MVAQERSKESIRRLKRLQQESLAKAFNVRLLSDMYLLAYFYCFVSLTLAKETEVEILGWFSDRDSMTTWVDGVIWDIATETLHGLAGSLDVKVPHNSPLVALPDPEAGSNPMWFDEFIRLPDYIAGILAAWNLDTNEIPVDKEKYGTLARTLMPDAKNMALFRIRHEQQGLAIARIVFSVKPFESSVDAA